MSHVEGQAYRKPDPGCDDCLGSGKRQRYERNERGQICSILTERCPCTDPPNPAQLLARLRAVPDIGDHCIHRWDEGWELHEDRPSSWRKTAEGAVREALAHGDAVDPLISVAHKTAYGWTTSAGVPASEAVEFYTDPQPQGESND